MINKEAWMCNIVDKLKRQFGSRLLFVGLQGSYQRDEATETSDFDVVTVLDELTVHDLDDYRVIVKTMPESEKACGFVSGRAELLNWPRYEIFQLRQDTKSYYGSLDGLLPAIDEADIRQSVKIAAANLYHAACHQYLFADDGARIADLKPLYKSVFFILQLVEYLRSGEYHRTKAALRQHLTGEEQALLETGMEWNKYQDAIALRPADYYEKLIKWCQEVLCDG